jgi:hypothetical protein
MKNLMIAMFAVISTLPAISFAEEGPLCNMFHSDVDRKVKLIKSYGTNLSRMARDKLYSDLTNGTEQCLAQCEGQKFKFCNDVALAIEQKKPL